MSFLINQVEFAVDMIVHDIDLLDLLCQFIDKHIVQRWHGKESVFYVEDTRYSKKKRSKAHQLVVYPEEKSRVAEYPCVHVEWRAGGKPKVQSLGIYDLEHLIDFNHRAFWKRRMCLAAVDLTKLGKLDVERETAKNPISRGEYCEEDYLRVGSQIAKAASLRKSDWTTQDVIDWCRDWIRRKSFLIPIDNAPYIPPEK